MPRELSFGLLRCHERLRQQLGIPAHEVGPRQIAQVDGALERFGIVTREQGPQVVASSVEVARTDERDGEVVTQRAVIGVREETGLGPGDRIGRLASRQRGA